MKKHILIRTAVILLITLNVNDLSAQDWNSIHPGGTSTLVDTTLIRSVVVTIDQGETIGPVTHPAHFAYILKGGRIEVDFQGKKSVIMNLKQGKSLFNNPEGPHKVTNIGDNSVSFLLVELKNYPYKKTAEKEE